MAEIKDPTAAITDKRFQEPLNILRSGREKEAGKAQELARAEGAVETEKQRVAEIESGLQTAAAEKEAGAVREARDIYQEKLGKEPLPEFVPTQDNVQSIASLFSLIGVMGMGGFKPNDHVAAFRTAMAAGTDGWALTAASSCSTARSGCWSCRRTSASLICGAGASDFSFHFPKRGFSLGFCADEKPMLRTNTSRTKLTRTAAGNRMLSLLGESGLRSMPQPASAVQI